MAGPKFSSRDEQDLHVLAGRRGPTAQHGVRFKDLASNQGVASEALARSILRNTSGLKKEISDTALALAGAKQEIANNLELVGEARDAANSVREDHDALVQNYEATVETVNTLDAEVVNLSTFGAGVLDYRYPILDVANLTAGSAAVTLEDAAGAFDRDGTVIIREGAHVRTRSGQTSGASFPVPPGKALMFYARRLRIAILAKKTDATPSSTASVVYSAGPAGATPITPLTPLTENWSWHLAYVDVPPAPDGLAETHHVGIFADNAQAGGGMRVAEAIVSVAAEAEELPEIAANRGLIEEIRGLDLDADSAFALWVNRVGVEVVDPANPDRTLTASYKQTASAFADLKGSLSSSALFQVQAGDKVSLLEMFAADGSGRKVSLVRIGADQILLDGTVALEKLVAGTGANLLQNTDFVQIANGAPLHWDHLYQEGTAGSHSRINYRSPGQSYAPAIGNSLEIFQDDGSTSGYAAAEFRPIDTAGNRAYGVQVEPDQWYEVQARISTHRCDGELLIVFRRADGTWAGAATAALDSDNRGSGTNPGLWKRYWVKGKAPADATTVTLRVRKNATQAGQANSYLFVSQAQLAETTGSAQRPNAFSPGSTTVIDGGNVMAYSLTADKTNFGTLSALRISADTLDIIRRAISDNVAAFRSETIGGYEYGEYRNYIQASYSEDSAVEYDAYVFVSASGQGVALNIALDDQANVSDNYRVEINDDGGDADSGTCFRTFNNLRGSHTFRAVFRRSKIDGVSVFNASIIVLIQKR